MSIEFIDSFIATRCKDRMTDGGRMLVSAIDNCEGEMPHEMEQAMNNWINIHSTFVDRACLRVAVRQHRQRKDVGRITILMSQGWRDLEKEKILRNYNSQAMNNMGGAGLRGQAGLMNQQGMHFDPRDYFGPY